VNIPSPIEAAITNIEYAPATTRFVTGPKSSLVLELSSLGLTGPTAIPGRSYDFVIPFENVSSIQDGWPLIFSPGASHWLGKADFQFENLQIVGILGYYSKGKSFILNHLYNLSTKGSRFTVAEGPSVTTRGFSGLFMNDGNSINLSNQLIIDTAGRNAPAFRLSPNGANQEMNDNGLGKQIDEIRAKERLIDDVIVDIANTIIYVVDEVLNEDQRTLLHLVDMISRQGRSQKLILVHNFKRIDYHNGTNHIQEQIIGAFGATNHHLNEQQRTTCGPFLQVWNSNYPILTSPGHSTVVMHVALFNQQTSSEYNTATFNFLLSITSTSQSGRTTPQNPIDRIAKSLADCLPTVVKVLNPPDGEEVKISAITEVDPPQEECSMMIQLEGHKHVELLRWDLLQLPTRESHGAWKPIQNNFILNDTFYARIDLPGLNESHRKATLPTENLTENWWCISVEKTRKNYEYQTYLISGYRERILAGDKQTVFGEFAVHLQVPHCFDHELVSTLTDGTLIIIGYDKETSEARRRNEN
jgi:hypothetical protein